MSNPPDLNHRHVPESPHSEGRRGFFSSLSGSGRTLSGAQRTVDFIRANLTSSVVATASAHGQLTTLRPVEYKFVGNPSSRRNRALPRITMDTEEVPQEENHWK
ncbi:unnamed protein product [Pleuronectes platessa]|uniref:Uncharacterized protein n=1 Tax=Pleuronectes platessa TaxID=8262 RepID=A0A9N7Y4T0_PLEPL|nr:unnamed protein product [Pleuronectes platessa]